MSWDESHPIIEDVATLTLSLANYGGQMPGATHGELTGALAAIVGPFGEASSSISHVVFVFRTRQFLSFAVYLVEESGAACPCLGR